MQIPPEPSVSQAESTRGPSIQWIGVQWQGGYYAVPLSGVAAVFKASSPSNLQPHKLDIEVHDGAPVFMRSFAQCFDLGPQPTPHLVQEEFHLVCLKSALDTPATQALRDFLQEASWQQALNSLPGYQTQHGGEVQSLSARLPWWAFPRAKKIR